MAGRALKDVCFPGHSFGWFYKVWAAVCYPRKRRAAVFARIKPRPSAGHVPGKVAGLELQAGTLFCGSEHTAKQNPQKFVGFASRIGAAPKGK
eukprot:1320808-Heterocapsa_arctica.AAC.1